MNGQSTQMADDMTGSAGRYPADENTAGGQDDGMDITLDKNVPEISDAFQGCKVGDTYTVKSDDDNELVLTKMPSDEPETPPGEEGSDTPGSDAAEPSSDNPAIAALIVKKNKS